MWSLPPVRGTNQFNPSSTAATGHLQVGVAPCAGSCAIRSVVGSRYVTQLVRPIPTLKSVPAVQGVVHKTLLRQILYLLKSHLDWPTTDTHDGVRTAIREIFRQINPQIK